MSVDRKEFLGWAAAGFMRRLQRSLERKTPAQVEAAGRRLGRLMMRTVKKRRERCLSNLKLAFPEMPDRERQELAVRTFEHFGICTADFLSSRVWTLESLEGSMEIEGKEIIDDALKAGKGAIVITGHFGNWERVNIWLGLNGIPLNVVVRTANTQGVDKIVNDLRERTGTKVIHRGNAARPIMAKLRNNEMVGIVPDQNSDEVFIPFFGHPAGTVLGPGVIHERSGAPVIPAYCIRTGVGKYKVKICPPLEPLPGYEVKGEGMMRAINAWLEEQIRETPEQWLWFHDRWRNARQRGLL